MTDPKVTDAAGVIIIFILFAADVPAKIQLALFLLTALTSIVRAPLAVSLLEEGRIPLL